MKKELKNFYVLWSTQGLSCLGSAMTGYALTLWLYGETGSALRTALLSICSYAPYVIMSIFAGALSDKWNKKKTMLVCDTLAACCTVGILILLKTQLLEPWHLYILNAVSGLMNTVQSPASDVAVTLITPKKYYQKTSGLRSLSRSLITILHPALASALYGALGMDAVIAFDLATFIAAFLALQFFVKIPEEAASHENGETLLQAAKSGLRCLYEHKLVLWLILFLAGVNLIASAFDAALPAFVLPRENGGEGVLGAVNSFAGVAMLVGSLLVSMLPAPKNRIRVILLAMLFSLTADNILMSLTNEPWIWCIAQVLGFLPVPIMDANLDVIVRSSIPTEMQGRVYSCRNTFQFFTIPIGSFLGGFLTDNVFEPFIAGSSEGSLAVRMFGGVKGSGAGMLIFVLAAAAVLLCAVFSVILRKYSFDNSSTS